MSNTPAITDQQIRARATSNSYTRGKSYYQNHNIFDMVKRGNRIEASCSGSDYDPYQVWVEFGSDDIIAAGCTCMYDFGGDCKHIVALMLTYLHEPQSFSEKATIDTSLKDRSKEDLVLLIKQMVNLYPDLQSLLDIAISVNPASDTPITPVDFSKFRKELHKSLENFYYEDRYDRRHGGNRVISAESLIQAMMETAKRFANQGQWKNVVEIYATIVEEAVQDDNYIQSDEDGSYGYVFSSVVEAIYDCLAQAEVNTDTDLRQQALNALMSAYLWDTELGGLDLAEGADDYILQYSKQEDIALLREALQKVRKQHENKRYGQWSVEHLDNFILQLDMLDNVDPEIILSRLREDGQYLLLAQRLFDMKRVDDAILVIRQHIEDFYDLYRLLNALIEAGRLDTAIELAEDFSAGNYDRHLSEWLIQQYQLANNKEKLLRVQKLKLYQYPAIATYDEVKETAKALDQWDTVRAEVIKKIENSGQQGGLVNIYLHEQEWDEAWKIAETSKENFYMGSLKLHVAEASAIHRPQKAIPILVEQAYKSIGRRDRGAYAQAASYLSLVHDAYKQLGDEQTWKELIGKIRAEFNRLPALQDELRKAGL